jgi:hypothetical protein
MYVRQFVVVCALKEMKVKVCSRVAETHNTRIKTIDGFTEDMKEMHLKAAEGFSTKHVY